MSQKTLTKRKGKIMGYNCEMVVFKKELLESFRTKEPLKDLYSAYLADAVDGKEIFSASKNVFKEAFCLPIQNGAIATFDKKRYAGLLLFLGDKLKRVTLYELVNDPEREYEYQLWIDIYKRMTSVNIDFETEIVLLQHDW